MQLSCPECSARDADVSKGPGIGGSIKALVGIYELRCRRCKTRWDTSVWASGDWKYARCPRCYRQNLTTWSVQDYRISQWTTMMLKLGATRYRCAPCRCNFTSFRPPKDQLAWEEKVVSARRTPVQQELPIGPMEEPVRARVDAPAGRAGLSAPTMRLRREDKAVAKPAATSAKKTLEAKPVVPVAKPAEPKPVPVAPAPKPVVVKPADVKPAEVTPIQAKPVPIAPAPKPVEAKPVPVAPAPKPVEAKPAPVVPMPKPAAPKPVPVPAPTPMPAAARVSAPTDYRSALNGIATIGRTMVIKGTIISGEDLTIDGEVEGTVELREHCLRIDSNGTVRAKIKARDVVISGTIHGDVETTDKLDIRKDGNLFGDINAHRLVIEEGATVKGQVITGAIVKAATGD